jgi:hypothetical protein
MAGPLVETKLYVPRLRRSAERPAVPVA